MKLQNRYLVLGAFVAMGLFLSGCSSDDGGTGMSDEEAELTAMIRADYGSELVPMPSAPPYPDNNSPSVAGFEARLDLGKHLFYDPVLSGDDDVACGHCHHPAFAWGDGRRLSIGVGGVGLGPDRVRTMPPGEPEMDEFEFMTPRNSPTVLDNGFYLPDPDRGGERWKGVMFWDGRSAMLEVQARLPIGSRDEMKHDAYGGPAAVDSVCAALERNPVYLDLFKRAFPEDLVKLLDLGYPETEIVNGGTYGRAMAAYERELYTADSPFDRFARGDDTALSMAQKRGLVVFFEAGCDGCHGGSSQEAKMMFSNFDFHALGVAQGGPGKPPIHEHGDGTDQGRFENTGHDADRFCFRVPTLRNIGLTAPYFHTGGEGSGGDYQTLRQVVEFFNRGGNDLGIDAAYLDPAMVPLGLSDQQMDDLVAFLESLTATRIASDRIDVNVPASVPSGLEPPAFLPPVLTN